MKNKITLHGITHDPEMTFNPLVDPGNVEVRDMCTKVMPEDQMTVNMNGLLS